MKEKNELRINREIRANEVRLIDENEQMIGVVPFFKAISMAESVGLDLVEISPNATPPVCKIVSYGKLKYQAQKKANDAKRKQKTVETKEIKMSLNIGQGDYDTKLKQATKFLEKDNNKVRFSFYFKGREITHVDLAHTLSDKIINELSSISKIDTTPKLEGKKMFFVLAPNKENKILE